MFHREMKISDVVRVIHCQEVFEIKRSIEASLGRHRDLSLDEGVGQQLRPGLTKRPVHSQAGSGQVLVQGDIPQGRLEVVEDSLLVDRDALGLGGVQDE